MKSRHLLCGLGMAVCILVILSGLVHGAPRPEKEISHFSATGVVANPEAIEFGPEYREKELTLDFSNVPNLFGIKCDQDYVLNDTVIALGFDWVYEILYAKEYTVKAIGTNCEVWVANDLGWGPFDPRDVPVVTDAQINYLLNEFESNIYQKDTEFFGIPHMHDGSNAVFDDILRSWGFPVPDNYYCTPDPKDRVIIMVDNIRDENYYDPSYPLYIAGGYHSAYDYYLDRNVITIDAYAWESRMGPPGPGIERPYFYEGVIAHELQHLIHYDMDPAEWIFIQEGCSDMAYFMCGYGHPAGHVEKLVDYPENSLTIWGDQGPLEITADYGICYLWMLYLYEHFGGAPFVKALVANPGTGIDGINAVLSDFGYRVDFEDVFRNFRIALLIDSSQPFCFPYISKDHHPKCNIFHLPHPFEFTNIDIHVNVDTVEASGPTYVSPTGTLINHAPPWGTDYIKIEDPEHLTLLKFDGSEFLPPPWTSDGSVLWSGAGNALDNFMIAEVDLTSETGSTLTFDTWYDIECGWDYGFVQVSTDGGSTWTSLANDDTTDFIFDPFYAHPTVLGNLPGFTGKSGLGIDPATGLPEDGDAQWVEETFDLSAYDGQVILLAFRYVTDYSVVNPGWLVDNIVINGSVLSDGSSTAGFKSIYEILGVDNDFSVTLVGVNERCGRTRYTVKEVHIRDLNEVGYAFLDGMIREGGYGVMLVSFESQKDVTIYAQYEYSFFDLFPCPCDF